MPAPHPRLPRMPAPESGSERGVEHAIGRVVEHAPASEQSVWDLLLAAPLVELSGSQSSARTSTAIAWVADFHQRGLLVAWVCSEDGGPFAPDMAHAGVDLDSLVVVRVPCRTNALAFMRSTEWLVRSGAFSLVVVDLIDVPSSMIAPRTTTMLKWQGRLRGMLHQQSNEPSSTATPHVMLLTATGESSESAGPLVSVRLDSHRTQVDDGGFTIHHRILKTKIGRNERITDVVLEPPDGLEHWERTL